MRATREQTDVTDTPEKEIRRLVDLQKSCHITDGPMSATYRIELIDRCIALLVNRQDDIIDAISTDFGHRSPDGTLATDIAGTIGALKYSKKNVRKWMKSSKRHSMFPLGLFGAKTRVDYQALGCVGNVVPWNFPFNLAFGPMGSIFSAGNRIILKPSEFTPYSAILIKELIEEYFGEDEAAVVLGLSLIHI